MLGRFRGFINLNESLILSDIVELLPKDKVVLEVLETVRPTPEVVARCTQLRRMGFSLAMDDVASADPAFGSLLATVEFVKIDLTQVAPGKLPALARHFKALNAKLLAEKVDTQAQVDECIALGFDYFQGYFFAKPEILSGRELSPAQVTLIELLGLILSDAEQSDLEDAVKSDAVLTLNLMRLTNSVATGARRHMTNLGDAIMVLGRRQLQRWLQLLVYANGETAGSVLNPLMQLAATRARLMELLAPFVLTSANSEDLAFMTGIMSLLDALLGQPLVKIVEPLPLAAEAKAALIGRSGPLGALLVPCERLEEGDPGPVMEALARLPHLGTERLNLAHAEALRWANGIAEAAAQVERTELTAYHMRSTTPREVQGWVNLHAAATQMPLAT